MAYQCFMNHKGSSKPMFAPQSFGSLSITSTIVYGEPKGPASRRCLPTESQHLIILPAGPVAFKKVFGSLFSDHQPSTKYSNSWCWAPNSEGKRNRNLQVQAKARCIANKAYNIRPYYAECNMFWSLSGMNRWYIPPILHPMSRDIQGTLATDLCLL